MPLCQEMSVSTSLRFGSANRLFTPPGSKVGRVHLGVHLHGLRRHRVLGGGRRPVDVRQRSPGRAPSTPPGNQRGSEPSPPAAVATSKGRQSAADRRIGKSALHVAMAMGTWLHAWHAWLLDCLARRKPSGPSTPQASWAPDVCLSHTTTSSRAHAIGNAAAPASMPSTPQASWAPDICLSRSRMSVRPPGPLGASDSSPFTSAVSSLSHRSWWAVAYADF